MQHGPPPHPHADGADGVDAPAVVAAVRCWLERAVIGLNLCPFARSEHVAGRIRYHVSPARTEEALLQALAAELRALVAADPRVCETTLLIHPHVLSDFGDYNQFLDQADAELRRLGLEGVIQVASFHPDYRFDGTDADDVTNCTNRSPYPILHLLREASVERAVAGYPDAGRIVDRNLETLRRLGHEGWRSLGIPGPTPRPPTERPTP